MKLRHLFVLAVLSTSSAAEPLRDGDIIFQTSRSSQSLAVQRATGSRYSHMGLVFIRDGKPVVFEAAGTVRYTPLDLWVARGIDRHFVVKRLRNAAGLLDAGGLERLRRESGKYAGRPYDLAFGWSDERLYCSELVWKIYRRALGIGIGELQKIKDFKLSEPAVRDKLKERYGDRVPLEETVISPAAMFDSAELVMVMER